MASTAPSAETRAIGLVKKVVLADNLVPIASRVLREYRRRLSGRSRTGMLAFSFQILLDFSGDTDIGRGSAQLLGYTVPANFNAPYLATSSGTSGAGDTSLSPASCGDYL